MELIIRKKMIINKIKHIKILKLEERDLGHAEESKLPRKLMINKGNLFYLLIILLIKFN